MNVSLKDPNLQALEKAATHRREDAQQLREAKRWLGAMYMLGYEIEFRLKSSLMKKYNVQRLQSLEDTLQQKHAEKRVRLGHSISRMLSFTGARNRMDRDVLRAYTKCNEWTVDWRYTPSAGREDQCDTFFKAVDVFVHFIEHNV